MNWEEAHATAKQMTKSIDPCPLKSHEEGRRTWLEIGTKNGGFYPAWEDLSEAARAYWLAPGGALDAFRKTELEEANRAADEMGWVVPFALPEVREQQAYERGRADMLREVQEAIAQLKEKR